MKVDIRRTCGADFPAIQKILQSAGLVGDWFNCELFMRLLARNEGFYFVATRNRVVLGTIFSSHDGGYFGYIYKLGVLPQYQREGIGSALLQRVINEFKKIGIDWYFCHVDKDNIASISVLDKYGIAPQTRFFMADNWSYVIKK
jgi:ribosomal protein S18 acetylase RimI-like enzyme